MIKIAAMVGAPDLRQETLAVYAGIWKRRSTGWGSWVMTASS